MRAAERDSNRVELARQRAWVEEHGSTLEGYRAHYERLNASNPQQVEQIWNADVNRLYQYERLVESQSEEGLHRQLQQGDVVTLRGRKFSVVSIAGASKHDANEQILWESLTLVLSRETHTKLSSSSTLEEFGRLGFGDYAIEFGPECMGCFRAAQLVCQSCLGGLCDDCREGHVCDGNVSVDEAVQRG